MLIQTVVRQQGPLLTFFRPHPGPQLLSFKQVVKQFIRQGTLLLKTKGLSLQLALVKSKGPATHRAICVCKRRGSEVDEEVETNEESHHKAKKVTVHIHGLVVQSEQ